MPILNPQHGDHDFGFLSSHKLLRLEPTLAGGTRRTYPSFAVPSGPIELRGLVVLWGLGFRVLSLQIPWAPTSKQHLIGNNGIIIGTTMCLGIRGGLRLNLLPS